MPPPSSSHSEMAPLNKRSEEQEKNGTGLVDTYRTQTHSSGSASNDVYESTQTTAPTYRLYKRRFFGLLQLTLLNIVVSWDWITFAPVSTSSARFFGVSQAAINWLSTSFLFAFVVATPAVIWTLNRQSGLKFAMIAASVLIFVGNWLRYAGTKANEDGGGIFGLVLFGQILIGFAQPFVLSAPPRYSDTWFSAKGRITATALASLANPFGAALGQLIDPFFTTKRSDVPNMVLYVAIISTVASLPSFFIPARPPTPPTASGATPIPYITLSTFKALSRNKSFYLVFIPFTIFVSAFNATSSLLNQILYPYGFSETDAGITGALLIVVGLVAAAITSPLLDRNPHIRYTSLRFLVPVIAAMYLALIWAPGTRTVAAPYAICAILGAASFVLVPLALELLVEITWDDAGPETGATLAWAGGQFGGAIFILIMDALKGGVAGQPPKTMERALIFQAVMCWVAVPFPLCIGYFGTGKRKREEIEAMEMEPR